MHASIVILDSRGERPYGFALRVRQLLYLGRPQDPYGFASCSTWGDPKTALAHRTGLTSCSTWGDPKTALAHRSPVGRLYYRV